MLHVDADGFFASVEQSLNPSLRGKPVVTGAERGIIAAASYEAKALNIGRGMQLHEAKALCPRLVILPSDYESYSIYSNRIFNILRRFTPSIEEYSIDEAFAEIATGRDVCFETPEMLAAELRKTVRQELGLTVSVGISLTKTLTKICSKFRKPDNQTVLRAEHIPLMLKITPIEKVWGIGNASAKKLLQYGISSALDFTQMNESAVKKLLHKPGHETWHELQGHQRFRLNENPFRTYDSMMKGHTFSPPSNNPDFIFAEAVNNMERALAKLRRHRHLTREIGLSLRLKEYHHQSAALRTSLPTDNNRELIALLRQLFTALFIHGQTYRSTTVWLANLEPPHLRQPDLFEARPQSAEQTQLHQTIDKLNKRFGSNSVQSAALLNLREKPTHSRDAKPKRYDKLLKGETKVRHLNIPRMTL
jgi:DNA polymerase-4